MGQRRRRRTPSPGCAGPRRQRGSLPSCLRSVLSTAREPAMLDPHSVHGGTDSLPDPRYDFSTNANPLGPCPAVLARVRNADVTRYPDPLYTRLREVLAAFHQISPERIVVGAGASELILRLIRCIDGPVQQLAPTFSEYGLGARLAGRRLMSARSPAAFLRAQ